MAWACEMTALEEAAAGPASGQDIVWLDFDHFLAAPAEQLTRLAAHFGHPLSQEDAARLASGPIMSRYAKAPEHAYSAELRRQVLSAARAAHGQEIGRGLAWLDAAADRYPPIRRALIRAEGGSAAAAPLRSSQGD